MIDEPRHQRRFNSLRRNPLDPAPLAQTYGMREPGMREPGMREPMGLQLPYQATALILPACSYPLILSSRLPLTIGRT